MAKPKAKTIKSTQSYLKVLEIKADTLILENGKYSAVIGVSSVNFALKSQEEQDAMIFGYQNFLNSLDFEVQILMQSRKMDIHSYLEKLNKLLYQQSNELLRAQTAEYIEFVSKLVEGASIMTKNFFIIVPFQPAMVSGADKKSSGLFAFFKKADLKKDIEERMKNFMDQKSKLDQRVNTVMSGLSSFGMRSTQLGTEQLIELLYNSYNVESGQMLDTTKLNELKIKQGGNIS